MEKVGIIPNWEKEKISRIVDEVVEYLEQAGVSVMVLPREEVIEVEFFANKISSWRDEVEVIIVIGGDGTILRVARELSHWDVPLLGINAGRKGFLAEVEEANLQNCLQLLLDGGYNITERMLLETSVERGTRSVVNFLALNDIVISRGPFSRIIDLKAFINQDYLETYSGDGLIVSTSTGSTAYSLSAGGPIVSPSLQVFVITPICPHSLYSRTVIVDSSETISIEVLTSFVEADIVLTMDGQVGFNLEKGDLVKVSLASCSARLIRFPGSSFYRLLHEKLKG